MKLIIFTISLILFFSGCSANKQEPTPTLKKSTYDYMHGFFDDDLDEALIVFKKACEKASKNHIFENVCENSLYYENGEEFFTKYFTPRILVSNKGDLGLITGYYEPLLYGSLKKTQRYKYPIYKTPKDLVTLKDKQKYMNFKRFKYKAKVKDGLLYPYDSREQIEKREDLEPIVYVDNKVDLFFLHIQGSGRVQLENGEIINIGYANQNGRKYVAIGKTMLEKGYLEKENISLQTIKKFLDENPNKIDEILNTNPSYIFFTKNEQTATGSLGVPLLAKRNIAVDRRHIPLGMPVFIQTKNPKTKEPINKLVVAADTGGAIKGEVRADFFFGYGNNAEELAGLMKEKGRLFILVPKI
ncbi:murein transglycosylase A [Malaciobacter sp. WC5094]